MKKLDNIVRIAVPGDGHCAIHTLYLIGYLNIPNFKQEPKEFILNIRQKVFERLGGEYKNVKEWLSNFEMSDLSKEIYDIDLVDINNPDFSMSKKQKKKKYAYYEFIEFSNNYLKDRREIEECNHFNLVIPLEEWENLSRKQKEFVMSYKKKTKINIPQREFNEIIKTKQKKKNNTKSSKTRKKKVQIVDYIETQQKQQQKKEQRKKKNNTKTTEKNKSQIVDLIQQQTKQQRKKKDNTKTREKNKIQIINLID